jgi:hypothetical protein
MPPTGLPKINIVPAPMISPVSQGLAIHRRVGPEDSMLPDELASPEAIRQQLYATGHLDVRI